MIICTCFVVDFDTERGVFFIINREAPVCPDCGQLLSGYDGRRRLSSNSSGEKLWFRLRRLRCQAAGSSMLSFLISGPEEALRRLGKLMKLWPAYWCLPADDSTTALET